MLAISMRVNKIKWSKGARVFRNQFNCQILFKIQTQLFVLIKLTVRMKFTNNNRLMNKLIINELIQDLFNYLSYLYLTS